MWHLEKVTSPIRIHYPASAWEAMGLPPPPWTPCPLPSCRVCRMRGWQSSPWALLTGLPRAGAALAVPSLRTVAEGKRSPSLFHLFNFGAGGFGECPAGSVLATSEAELRRESGAAWQSPAPCSRQPAPRCLTSACAPKKGVTSARAMGSLPSLIGRCLNVVPGEGYGGCRAGDAHSAVPWYSQAFLFPWAHFCFPILIQYTATSTAHSQPSPKQLPGKDTGRTSVAARGGHSPLQGARHPMGRAGGLGLRTSHELPGVRLSPPSPHSHPQERGGCRRAEAGAGAGFCPGFVCFLQQGAELDAC